MCVLKLGESGQLSCKAASVAWELGKKCHVSFVPRLSCNKMHEVVLRLKIRGPAFVQAPQPFPNPSQIPTPSFLFAPPLRFFSPRLRIRSDI